LEGVIGGIGGDCFIYENIQNKFHNRYFNCCAQYGRDRGFYKPGGQLNDLSNTASILTLWILGGILALSGAFSYAEIGTVIKK
jgi:hypothetical protein